MSGKIFKGNLEPKFNPFDDDYLAEILEAVALAWARMKHPDGREIEDRTTYRMAGRLANDPHFAELPYDIIAQCWLLGLNGQRVGRLDLRFKHRRSQRDYFAFEAKRLHVTYPKRTVLTGISHLCGRGWDDGLCCRTVFKGTAGGRDAWLRDGWQGGYGVDRCAESY